MSFPENNLKKEIPKKYGRIFQEGLKMTNEITEDNYQV